MWWGRIRRVFRTCVLVGLSVGATAALVAALANPPYWRPKPIPPNQLLDARTTLMADKGPYFSTGGGGIFRKPIIPSPLINKARYSVYLDFCYGEMIISHYDKQCLTCGRYPPDHAWGCIFDTRQFSVAYKFSPRTIARRWAVPGFSWETGVDFHRFTEVSLSLWLTAFVFGVYPVIALVHGPLRRMRRGRAGRCIGCGYNLTGNLSGRCPECGRPTAAAEPAAPAR